MTKICNFKKDLAFSNMASHESFWQSVYRESFPDMLWNKLCEGKTQGQYLGIDRIIYLKSGKTLSIDEKKRREEYDDFCLEFKHEGESYNGPGWMEKELQIDYLAYAFFYSQRCFLLPWLQLRKVWLKNKEKWATMYKVSKAQNSGYFSYGLCVPIEIVLGNILETIILKIPMQKEENKKYCRDLSQRAMRQLTLF